MVVDLPDPVSPVTKMMPRCTLGNSSTALGTPSESRSGMCVASRRSAMLALPCWRKMLPRMRRPFMLNERSSSPQLPICSKASPPIWRA